MLQELALLEYTVLNFPPSVVAAAAVLLAQSYEGVFTSASQLQRVSGYSPQVLGTFPCMLCLPVQVLLTSSIWLPPMLHLSPYLLH